VTANAGATVSARFAFDGAEVALARLRAQIDRIVSYETVIE
jgi:hypothetical protein